MLKQQKIIRYYLVFFLIIYPILFYLRIKDIEPITKFLIPTFVFIVFVFTFYFNRTNNILLSISMFFVFCGDFIINLTPVIKLSFIPFSLTHIFLAIYFFTDTGFKKKDLAWLFVVFSVAGLVVLLVKNTIETPIMLLTFIGYITLLSIMLWRAICYSYSSHLLLKKWIVITGALCFYFTDIFVSLFTIYHNKLFILFIWILYPPALFLLSITNRTGSSPKL